LKKTTFAPVPYKPGPVPTDLPASAQRYLDSELNRIASLLQIILAPSASLMLTSTDVEPSNPSTPMVIYTSGLWDPGSGEGYYYYNQHGVWTPLG
jgi:hypothetical protein